MKKAPAKMMKKSPAKAKSKAAKNLLKAVPNEKAYKKLSSADKKGFDKAAKKAGLPTKKSPAKKPLVGKQKNLPEQLKNKILASPAQMKKSSMKMKKSKATPFKMKNQNSPAKCWKTHKKVGMKKSPTRPGVMVNDCVKK